MLTDDLLREAGSALARAGLRLDLVFAIENVVGPLPGSEGPPKIDTIDAMRRAAKALADAGRPMLAAEIAAAAFPDVPACRVRGWCAVFKARQWLAHGPKLPGAGQANSFVLGSNAEWRDRSQPDEAAQLREEVRALRQRLAETTAAARSRSAT